MKFLRYTAIIAAAMCVMTAASCGKNNGSSSKADTTTAGETAASGEAQTDGTETGTQESAEEIENRIYEAVKDEQKSTDAPDLGTAGELVTPDEDDEEAKLGEYCVCDDGVKLYYDESIYPQALAMTLKEYFKSFVAGSYTDYTKCTYPTYIDGMDAYLQKDYGYDLKRSFSKQCANLESKAGGKYTITRIKIEPHGTAEAEAQASLMAEAGHEGEETATQNDPQANINSFFDSYSSALGSDYKEKTQKETDKFYDMDFYVMVKCEGDDSEQLLLGGYEIIFAEKDGRFYTFG